MPTRGTEFIGTELLKQVAGNYDRRINELCEEINSLNSLTIQERHAAWRASAEHAVRELFSDITQDRATDAQLSGFRIGDPPGPRDHRWSIEAKEGEIERLQRAKDKALAYINSLAADQGVVTLAAADLRRIGYQP